MPRRLVPAVHALQRLLRCAVRESPLVPVPERTRQTLQPDRRWLRGCVAKYSFQNSGNSCTWTQDMFFVNSVPSPVMQTKKRANQFQTVTPKQKMARIKDKQRSTKMFWLGVLKISVCFGNCAAGSVTCAAEVKDENQQPAVRTLCGGAVSL